MSIRVELIQTGGTARLWTGAATLVLSAQTVIGSGRIGQAGGINPDYNWTVIVDTVSSQGIDQLWCRPLA